MKPYIITARDDARPSHWFHAGPKEDGKKLLENYQGAGRADAISPRDGVAVVSRPRRAVRYH